MPHLLFNEMKKLLILISLVCCLGVVKAQDCVFDLFLFHSEATDRGPTPIEFVGLSLMSVGGCMVGVEGSFTQDQKDRRGNSISLTGAVMMLTGFVTYIVGSIRFNERKLMESKISST